MRHQGVWGLLFGLMILIVGCETTPGPKATVGGLGGAAAGGLLAAAMGGNTATMIGGAVTGGVIGAVIGDQLDRKDRDEAYRAVQRALETAPANTPVDWQNPDSGNYGTVIPKSTHVNDEGYYCREFQQMIMLDGMQHQAFGTACRDADGTWYMDYSRS